MRGRTEVLEAATVHVVAGTGGTVAALGYLLRKSWT
jgi:hypothetical protein